MTLFITLYFIIEFEEMAASEVKKERHIPPGEAQFVLGLIQDHGNNYKVNKEINTVQ